MQSAAFRDAIAALVRTGMEARTAIMCAEAVPWRCHRSLIADALVVRGIEVVEILSETSWRMPALTPFARIDGTPIIYPPAQATLFCWRKGLRPRRTRWRGC